MEGNDDREKGPSSSLTTPTLCTPFPAKILLAALVWVPKAGISIASWMLLRGRLALQKLECVPLGPLTQSDISLTEYMGTTQFNEKDPQT